jgi:PAS domain S-box-containing protein
VESALQQAQTSLLRYQELFDFAPDAYLVTDLHAVIQEANYAAAALFATRKQFLVDKPLVFYVDERDRRTFAANLFRLTQPDENHVQWEMTLCPPRTLEVYTVVTATTIRTAGQASGFRWNFKDITGRRQLEETLRAEKEFSDSLVEMANAVILVLDGAGCIMRVNSYLCELTGCWRAGLVGQHFADLLLVEDQSSAQQALAGIVNATLYGNGVHHLRDKNGQTRTLAWSARVITVGPDVLKQVLFVGNDVTDLQEAQQRALQAERLAVIGKLSAGLAHECRNCLQRGQACLAMLGYLLTDQPEALDLLRRAQKAQDDLHRLYEEVRDYAAPIHLELRRCYLSEVWQQAWDDVGPLREGKGAVLVEEYGGVNLECQASPFHLLQLFRNLFENALAAAACRITVRCARVDLDGREAIEVAVHDNGPGFTEEDKRRAFDDFFTTKVHGTGLGLAICKRIVEAHGGRITVGASAEPGAVLVITLPRKPSGN